MRSTTHRAFTLIEVLFVVVILGILASIVMAIVSLNQADSRRVSAELTAQRVERAILLYRQQTGKLPDLANGNWAPLLQRTTVDGVAVGPFLQGMPRNLMVTGDQSLVVDAAAIPNGTSCAFAYDYHGGEGSGKFMAAGLTATP